MTKSVQKSKSKSLHKVKLKSVKKSAPKSKSLNRKPVKKASSHSTKSASRSRSAGSSSGNHKFTCFTCKAPTKAPIDKIVKLKRADGRVSSMAKGTCPKCNGKLSSIVAAGTTI